MEVDPSFPTTLGANGPLSTPDLVMITSSLGSWGFDSGITTFEVG